jgi:ABC-2 type transport system permease protein
MKVMLPHFVLMQVMVGVGSTIGFSFIIPDINRESALFISTGGAALSLISIGLVLIPEMIAEDKEKGIFEYLWSLPISKPIFLMADLTVWTILTLPGVILSLITGVLYYKFTLDVSILIIPAFILVILTSTIIGYTIAHASPKGKLTILISNILIYSLFLFSPVSYPIERLPGFLIILHKILPIKYMSDLIRGNLTDIPVESMNISFLVVFIWCVVCFGATYKIITHRK